MARARLYPLSIVLLVSILNPTSHAQVTDAITISITQPTDQSGIQFINGYRRSIDGQTIAYHSSHPDAESALLVRARRDVRSIVWETDTLSSNAAGDFYHLIWLAGIAKEGWIQERGKVHRFDLSINGERWFTFYTRKDSTAERWAINGREGSELSFETHMVDKFGDLFGHMTLKLPKDIFPPGSPLTLKAVGEDAESPDWFMTFQYSFTFTPKLRVEPALVKEGNRRLQVLRLSLDNLRAAGAVDIATLEHERITKPLNIGANIFMLPIDAVESAREMTVTFKVNEEVIQQSTLTIKPVVYRDVYLLSYSHNDIGYTDLQPNIERKQWRNLEQALDLIKRTSSYPPEAQYRWNIETIWSLDSYLHHASAEKRQEIFDAVKSSHLGLNALYANVLTGLANGVEMQHFTECARRLKVEHSIPITTAVVSDIPGFTWGIVPVLAQSGVKYFASAPNSFDRVGHVYEGLGDKPFYWISQSGVEKVLMWLAAASYSTFHEGELSKLGDEKILKLMRKLDETNYPYDIVQLPYTIGGDNGPPDSTLSDFVKDWNERYASPRLIVATHGQMFREFERKYGSTPAQNMAGTLPSMRGDFTPYWEDGAASTAHETALNRCAADRLIQAEALWSMTAPESFPAKEFDEAWRNVVMYDEHTWGAHNSITDPDSDFVIGQWKIKQKFAFDADRLSTELLERALSSSNEPSSSEKEYTSRFRSTFRMDSFGTTSRGAL